MEDNKNAIDVNYVDIENEIYLTAPQLAQKINDTDIRVRHWGDSFGDIIGLEKVNGRKRYKESDVPKFAFIKDLLENKNFTHEQARVYLSKHGFKYAEYDSGLVDTKDPLGFQVLAAALSVEVDNKLNQFTERILFNISDQLNQYLISQQNINMEMKAEIESAVDETVSKQTEYIEQLEKKIESLSKQNEKIIDKIDSQEQKSSERDTELINRLKKSLDERQLQQEYKQQLQQKRSIFQRLFRI